jgi:hypothetical protein
LVSTELIPDTVGVRVVQCLVNHPAFSAQPQGVCSQKIFIGYPPLPVQDFRCLSDNWHSLNCTWRQPANPVETFYTLAYREPGSFGHFRSCPSLAELEDHLGRHVPDHSCYIDMTTDPPYRQVLKNYTFVFNATNRLLPQGWSQSFDVDHYAVVKPGQPINASVESMSPSELLLTYSVPKQLWHFG